MVDAREGSLMRRSLPVLFAVAAVALVAWLWWPLATELLHAGIPTDPDDHRVSRQIWLTGFIVISAVFITLGVKNIGNLNGKD
jgi:hypothetical protein